MDPFEDIFRSATSGDTSSTIDDDFDALFGNITVPSSSDLDSILCEDDSLIAQDTDPPIEERASQALGDEAGNSTAARVNPKAQDGNETVTSASSDLPVCSPGQASADLLTSLETSVPSAATSSSAVSEVETSKDLGIGSLQVDESENPEAPVVPDLIASTASAQKSSNDLLFDLGEETKWETSAKGTSESDDISDIFAAPSKKNESLFYSPAGEETDLFAKPSKETDIFASQSKEEMDLFATPSKKKTDNFVTPPKNEADLFSTPSEKETDIFATQPKEEIDLFTTPSKKSKDETDLFSTAPSQKPTNIFAAQTDEMDIFSTPPEKKTDILSSASEEEPDIFAPTSKKKPATGTSIFDDEEETMDFLSSLSSKEKVENANQPLDALPKAADVKSGETTLLDTAADDKRESGDCQDLAWSLDGLPEISSMEKTEAEPLLMEKEMDSSWILITDASGDGDLVLDKDKEKEVEKEDETEKDRDEKEKGETDNRVQSDGKGPPAAGDNFMDFSILELPGYAHLNLDVNKHKRTLSKKGSISRRKRPTRAAIHSGGTESEEMHFQDSTEPKPKVPDMSSDESKAQNDELFGGRDQSEDSVKAPEPSHHKPMTGGIKIPGLLEGLSKAKPFARKTKKDSKEEEFKKPSVDSEKKDTTAAPAASKKPIPVPRPFGKSAVPPATSVKPSALSRVLPVPPSSKILKDSQNKNIVEAEASVKPSSLKDPTPSGPAKLPAMKTEPPSSSSKLGESTKTPPPVARKPTVPSKPKTPPKSGSAATSSPVKLKTSTATSKDKESVPETNATATTTLKKETPSPAKPPLQVPPKPRLKPISSGLKDGISKTTSSPSVTEKSNITLSSVKHPLPGIDKLSEKKSELNEKIFEKKENIPLSPTKDVSKSKNILSMEKKKENNTDSEIKTSGIDKDEGSKTDLKPRKASISGISPVSPPMAGEKSAPRKNSITGSAYAPIGFRSTIGSMTDGEGKSRTSSISSVDETRPSLSRQSSEGQSTVIVLSATKSSIVQKDQDGEPAVKSKPADLTNGKSSKPDSDSSVLKETNGSIVDDTAEDKTPVKSVDANEDNGGTPWGVQLRRTEKKVPPPKPMASKETENPVNWRQSLGQRRRSSAPKEPVVEKPSEPEKPDWMKELSERRRRLINSGFIATDAK